MGRLADLVTPQNAIHEIGVLGVDLTPAIRDTLQDLRGDKGIVVALVAAGTPFSQQGRLAPGDVIYAINGKPVDGVERLKAALAALPQNAPFVLHVERGGTLLYRLSVERCADIRMQAETPCSTLETGRVSVSTARGGCAPLTANRVPASPNEVPTNFVIAIKILSGRACCRPSPTPLPAVLTTLCNPDRRKPWTERVSYEQPCACSLRRSSFPRRRVRLRKRFQTQETWSSTLRLTTRDRRPTGHPT